MGRVTFRNIFIIMAALILLAIASIPADISIPVSIPIVKQNTEPTLWMYTASGTSESAGDLFVKREGADAVKAADRVLIGSHVPFNNGTKLLYLDDVQRLYLLQLDVAAELIAEDIPMFQYGFSGDGRKVFYKTAENNLFIKEIDAAPIRIAEQVNYYRIAADGITVYYIDTNDNLYAYSQPDTLREIASGVIDFSTSDDGTSIIYLDQARRLYLVQAEQSPVEITGGEMKTEQSAISADGTIITYSTNYQEEGGFSDLYVYHNTGEGLRSIKAAEEVTNFHIAAKGDNLYYLNRKKQLFQYVIATGNDEMISEDVLEFKTSPDEQTILYLLENHDLYAKQNLSQSARIASDVSNSEFVSDNNILFTEENTHVYYKRAGQEKMKLSGLEQYVVETDHIYYVTSHGSLKVIPTDQEEAAMWVTNIEKYRRIYTNLHLLYKKVFDLKDLIGDWRYSDRNGYMNFSEITAQQGLLTILEDDEEQSIPYIIQFVSETKVHLLLLGEEEGEMVISKSGEGLTLEVSGRLDHLIKVTTE